MEKAIDNTKKSAPLMIIAEDDLDDRLLVTDALLDNGFALDRIIFVDDGQKLMELLDQIPQEPVIILLDLNMPRLDGRQALKLLKSDARYRHIPVLIFTTSNAPSDIELTYQQGANSYFTKPTSFAGLREIFALISNYWFNHAALPIYQATGQLIEGTTLGPNIGPAPKV